ncbi:alpha-1,2-fucosyltransferase [Pusillimonas minor]|uniref:Alpha-1,2-fucosyltransferase n=1 Tax=Pusillimonas minor TaxID=2697024 RepID=A0A842HUY0_9BURK|nr:alpha-1,2-fucosyltransferase [Pusillimonas minor]MBC2770605.1 alpha-1,2-fucosyltransferase [Pusillimonas minor]
MQTKRVVSRLNGGLGNQMFQYAFGRTLADRMNARFYIEIGKLDSDPLRSYALSGFCISAERMDTGTLRREVLWPDGLLRRLRWLPTLPGCLSYLAEKSFVFDPRAAATNHSVCADGYWQSPKYFEGHEIILLREFQLAAPMTAVRQETAARIKGVNAVSVHVRRGDYVANAHTQAFHGLCSPSWYEAAMQEMALHVDQPYFFVFSDDTGWSRENIRSEWPMHFIEVQPDGRDFEDMHLISLCQHHIIANSSFSWWGAWLNQKPGKRVIAPAKWFNQAAHDTRDLLPSAWQRL